MVTPAHTPNGNAACECNPRCNGEFKRGGDGARPPAGWMLRTLVVPCRVLSCGRCCCCCRADAAAPAGGRVCWSGRCSVLLRGWAPQLLLLDGLFFYAWCGGGRCCLLASLLWLWRGSPCSWLLQAVGGPPSVHTPWVALPSGVLAWVPSRALWPTPLPRPKSRQFSPSCLTQLRCLYAIWTAAL